jgi:hypothetical protein
MTALDFFLYDNRTLSPRWGRDWGLKAATGALAERADLKAAFDRYCGAMPGEQGQLHGFGEALGGVRSPGRNGYLLCVTLESSDSFGRPSWAVFGLWCPDSATLEQVLAAGDPIGSARALLGSETPLGAIQIRPARSAVGPRRRRRASAETTFYRFDPRSTVRDVTALLLGTAERRTALPNVLGITATSRFAAVAQPGFDVVYCHPLEERAERALARVLSPRELEVEEPAPPPTAPTIRTILPSAPGPPKPSRPRPSTFSQWLLWLAAGTLGVGGVFLLAGNLWRDPLAGSELSPPGEEEVSASEAAPVPKIPAAENRSPEAVLSEVRERLEEWKKLAPEDLRQSPGFWAAENLPVLPEHQECRNQVQQAYSALIEIRDRMVKRRGNYVAYYYDEAG